MSENQNEPHATQGDPVAALERLERRLRESEAARKHLQQRFDNLEKDIATVVDLDRESRVGALGGRQTIKDYGDDVWGAWIQAVIKLRTTTYERGFYAGKFAAIAGVYRDFCRLYGRAPATIREARAREFARVRLLHHRMLCGPELRHARYRLETIVLAMEGGAPSTVWRLLEKTPETREGRS
jgi:hypothetical protein